MRSWLVIPATVLSKPLGLKEGVRDFLTFLGLTVVQQSSTIDRILPTPPGEVTKILGLLGPTLWHLLLDDFRASARAWARAANGDIATLSVIIWENLMFVISLEMTEISGAGAD